MKTLAQRLMACKHFRWMSGMHAHAGRVLDVREAEICLADEGATEDGNTVRWVDSAGLGPYLTDPATLGCLLALVREAYQDPNMTLHFHSFLGVDDGHERGRGWAWLNHGHEIMPIGWHTTEAEALVAALEAA